MTATLVVIFILWLLASLGLTILGCGLVFEGFNQIDSAGEFNWFCFWVGVLVFIGSLFSWVYAFTVGEIWFPDVSVVEGCV